VKTVENLTQMQESTYQALSAATPADPVHLTEVASYFLDVSATLLAFVNVYPRGVKTLLDGDGAGEWPHTNGIIKHAYAGTVE
jgi:hypothetical protein